MDRRDFARSMALVATLGIGGSLLGGVADAATKSSIAASKAKSKIGSSYRYGASGPTRFDCSGLLQWAYKQAGVTLPRTTKDQVKKGKAVSYKSARVGDAVFFYSNSHVGIYIGNGQIVHAPGSGKKVRTEYVKYMGTVSAVRRYA